MANDINKINQIAPKLLMAMKEATSIKNMKTYARSLANDIKKRTRLGYGVPYTGSSRERLLPLSQSYIEQRRGNIAFATIGRGPTRRVISYVPNEIGGTRKSPRSPDLSNETSPTKSNLTFTGQMLNALAGTSGRREHGEVYLLQYRRGTSLTNSDIARLNEENGRPFMYASDLQIKRLTNLIRETLLSYL